MITRFARSRSTFALAILMAALSLPGLAMADVKGPNGKIIECFCTDTQGYRHEIGDIICLTVDGRSYMAKCIMAQNVPFWRDQEMGCLSSQVPVPLMTPWPDKATTQVAAICQGTKAS